MLLPVLSAGIHWHFYHDVPQLEVTEGECHPPIGSVDGLTLLLAASKVSLDGGIFFEGPHQP
jgi:hypothetical protein